MLSCSTDSATTGATGASAIVVVCDAFSPTFTFSFSVTITVSPSSIIVSGIILNLTVACVPLSIVTVPEIRS